jgi:hypothetical protein
MHHGPTFFHGSHIRTKVIKKLLILFIYTMLALPILSVYAQDTPPVKSQISQNTQEQRATPRQKLEGIPLPKKRGFWGMFFFWGGGVLCMYWVGRHLFREQSHERNTLRRFRDELGHFFPEFDPININKWVTIAAQHLYANWHSGEWESMKSFTTDHFIETQQVASASLKEEGLIREAYLGKILNVHLLGAYLQEGYQTPPLGVELICRIEIKAIDFRHYISDPDLVIGVKKPRQEQQIWTLRHTGHTWKLHQIEVATDDITNLKKYDPLPEIISWKKKEVEV